ncbi:hypothetical protein SKAU_G00257260 [Synaphobranchus kaupii]|uniref:Uncharacterized protein n=1 Tax=Synaphobranchus kaupii TaxID=118154 RepID=A0A9Q1F444_SYNKA|nr:hypothetical protein SKAU_G00257260 [Synaphobranchus kaupii]
MSRLPLPDRGGNNARLSACGTPSPVRRQAAEHTARQNNKPSGRAPPERRNRSPSPDKDGKNVGGARGPLSLAPTQGERAALLGADGRPIAPGGGKRQAAALARPPP